MDFKDAKRIPGTIIDVDDPECLGRVKAIAPGLFNENIQDRDVMPWIYPENMRHYQSFSMPVVGAKIWIIHNTENYNELWWRPMFEYIDCTENVVAPKYNHSNEVILSRPTPKDCAQTTYDDVDGHITKIDEWHWHMKMNGDIVQHGELGDIDIRGGHVYIGRNENNKYPYEPAVRGKELSRLFNDMSVQFGLLATSHGTGDNGGSVPQFQELQRLTEYNATKRYWCENLDVN